MTYGINYNNLNYVNQLNLYKQNSSSKLNNNPFSSLGSLFGGTDKAQSVDYSAVSFVAGLKTGSASLKNAVQGLTSASLFSKKAAASSDTDKMTVETEGTKLWSANSGTTAKSVRIEQLASGQKNQGAELLSDVQVNSASTGYKQFSIETGGKTYQLSIDVKDGDTNKDVQQKMADAINKADIGVTASVVSDDKTKSSTLNIESKGTGTGKEGTFSIKDVSGNAVQMTGAGNIAKDAQDAVYYLDGSSTAKTSKSNTVDIGGGVTATFKQAGSEAVNVTKSLDTNNIVEQVKKFADSYNSLFSSVRDYDDAKGDKLFTKLINTSKTYAGALSKIGIGFDERGNMTVDEDKLNSAIENGDFENFIKSSSGSNYGYLSQLNKTAGDVYNNTGKYVSGGAFTQMSVYSPYQVATAASYTNLGMLFDMSF